jgi:hypothetical protein
MLRNFTLCHTSTYWMELSFSRTNVLKRSEHHLCHAMPPTSHPSHTLRTSGSLRGDFGW